VTLDKLIMTYDLPAAVHASKKDGAWAGFISSAPDGHPALTR
jgi:hypothetical protein